MNILVAYSLLFIIVIVSGAAVLFVNSSGKQQSLKLIIAFGGAYLLSLSVLHLIPEIYALEADKTGYYILAGFFIQIMLDFFSRGIEHGHSHHHDKHFPFAVYISLCLHSFIEGMPVSAILSGENHFSTQLVTGIVLHKIPVSVVLMGMLLNSDIGKQKSFFWLIVFAAMIPAGGVFNYFLSTNVSVNYDALQGALLGVVAGIFLHVSTTILFESSDNHKFNLLKFITIILGAAAALI